MAGLLASIFVKVGTGVASLIKNAQAGKAALASGYLPGINATLPGGGTVTVSNQTPTGGSQQSGTMPSAPVLWYKNPLVIAAGVVAAVFLLFQFFKSLSKR